MSESSCPRPSAPLAIEVARDHIRILRRARPDEHLVLLTELLVAVYPSRTIQDS